MSKQEMYHKQPCFCLPCKMIRVDEAPISKTEKKVKRVKKSVSKKQAGS